MSNDYSERDFQVWVGYVIGLHTFQGKVSAEIDFSFVNDRGRREMKTEKIEFGDVLAGVINKLLNERAREERQEASGVEDMTWEGGPP